MSDLTIAWFDNGAELVGKCADVVNAHATIALGPGKMATLRVYSLGTEQLCRECDGEDAAKEEAVTAMRIMRARGW